MTSEIFVVLTLFYGCLLLGCFALASHLVLRISRQIDAILKQQKELLSEAFTQIGARSAREATELLASKERAKADLDYLKRMYTLQEENQREKQKMTVNSNQLVTEDGRILELVTPDQP